MPIEFDAIYVPRRMPSLEALYLLGGDISGAYVAPRDFALIVQYPVGVIGVISEWSPLPFTAEG